VVVQTASALCQDARDREAPAVERIRHLLGPKAPVGQKSNWIPTRKRKPFFVMFRIYGPKKEAVDGSWMLPDIELLR